jgi:hypothetical protein
MNGYGSYCERVELGWFAEPLNTIAALAFVLAAVQLWRHCKRDGLLLERSLVLMIFLIGAIGVTSTIEHTTGNSFWFALSLILFGLWALVFWDTFLRRVLRLAGGSLAVVWLLSFAIVIGALGFLPLGAFGGVFLLTPLVFLVVAGIVASLSIDRRLMRDFAMAAALLLLALVFWALDDPLCGWVVVGTHWLWHLLAAAVLYVLVDGLGRHLRMRLELDS